MIQFDPLYLLLLFELLLIQSAAVAFLYLKRRNLIVSHDRSLKIIRDFNREKKETEVEKNDDRKGGIDQEPSELSPLALEAVEEKKADQETEAEVKRLKQLVEEKMEIILQMKGKIEQFEKKQEDMEKEYLILFGKSQQQEEALRQYEGVRKDLPSI